MPLAGAAALLVLPLVLQATPARIADMALLLRCWPSALNMVGYAGLLSIWLRRLFAVGAYTWAGVGPPHYTESFPAIAAAQRSAHAAVAHHSGG